MLVDLKRYSFSGYVKTSLRGDRGPSIGYVVVIDGNPQLAMHEAAGKVSEGKVGLKSVWEDSYAEKCEIEIHAKVDVQAIRQERPSAVLERTRRPVRRGRPAAEAEEKVGRWAEAGYEVAGIRAALRDGGGQAAQALADFEAGVVRMEPLRRELEALEAPSLRDRIDELRKAAKDPASYETVARGLAEVREALDRTPPADATPVAAAQPEVRDRARQVFETIVRHRRSAGMPTAMSEAEVARVIEEESPVRDARTNLIRQYMFDTFVVGPSNRFAHAACLAVAKSPHTAYNPLFLTSGPGLGKTHLLNAIGNAMLEADGTARVIYVTAEAFANEFRQASASDALQTFREKYREGDVVLVDDAHFLSGKGDVQEELFHTFNDLYNANKQIVLTSDRLPQEIVDLEERLVSRFQSGLIADIQPPVYETRAAILRRRTRDAGVEVDGEVIGFIARRVERNVRELGGALNRVLAFSSLMGQPVSLDVAREVLRDLAAPEVGEAFDKVARAEREIRAGQAYLVEEDRPHHAFRLLHAAAHGGRALVITRSNPKRVRERHDIPEGRMLWLTERESTAVETIRPSLERIIFLLEEFMAAHDHGVVLLDGVEYLVSSNSFDAVLKFLRRLVDHTSESQFVLLVSLSTKTMREQQTKNLEREMVVLSF